MHSGEKLLIWTHISTRTVIHQKPWKLYFSSLQTFANFAKIRLNIFEWVFLGRDSQNKGKYEEEEEEEG